LFTSYHIISYHITSYVDLKRQNRLKVRTDKPKLKLGLKVKMQSVSDDDFKTSSDDFQMLFGSGVLLPLGADESLI